MTPADRHLDRATLLYQQRRYADAERELRAALALDPAAPRPHAVLALVLANQEKFAEASAEADAAVGAGPDLAFAHYVRGFVLYQRNRYDEATPAAAQAVALDPYDADYRWLVGAIAMSRRDWPAALAAADEGLAAEPEHPGCTNLRAIALVNLGRRAEAGAAIGAALAKDPDNAVTHANQGWALLHEGKPTEAMTHFREALRLDPNLEWARAGIVEALKAKNVVYRLMLRYFLWSARLGSQAQWGIMVGGYLGYRFLSDLAGRNPAAAPYIRPLLVAYAAFAIGTWLADPLFNLLLRFNRFGRLALSKRQTWASNVLAALLLLAGAALAVGLAGVGGGDGDAAGGGAGGGSTAGGGGFGWFVLALVFALLTVPAMGCFRLSPGWPTKVMVLATAALAAVGLSSAVGWFVVDRLVDQSDDAEPVRDALAVVRGLQQAFVIGFIASQFGYNYLRGVEPKK
jgi:tetratricopeptide (TPR) repeat protein